MHSISLSRRGHIPSEYCSNDELIFSFFALQPHLAIMYLKKFFAMSFALAPIWDVAPAAHMAHVSVVNVSERSFHHFVVSSSLIEIETSKHTNRNNKTQWHSGKSSILPKNFFVYHKFQIAFAVMNMNINRNKFFL